MSKKFMSAKTIVVPIISLIILISQIMPSFAATNSDITALMAESPNVTIQLYDNQSVEKREVAYNNIVAMVEASEADYDDVKTGAWYYSDVKAARAAGYVVGVGNNLYSPNSEITYAEYLTVTTRIVNPSIDDSAKSTPWYSKYIDYSKSKGILAKGESITPTVGIPRQEMVKYTCKALGIKPSTSAQILFEDVSPEDAAYINAAYEEYLIDGTRLPLPNKPGSFGFDSNAKRSELAAMANRLAEYKKNPEEYKAKREAIRQEARDKVNQANLIDYNGYKIPKDFKNYVSDDKEFYGWVRYRTNEEDFGIVQSIIASKLGNDIAKQAVDYARTKVYKVNLPGKRFNTESGYSIYIFSAPSASEIDFQISKLK